MALAIVFRPEAENDVLQTRHWYEQQMAGLGDAFADSLVEIVNRVEMMPQMYPVTRHNVCDAEN